MNDFQILNKLGIYIRITSKLRGGCLFDCLQGKTSRRWKYICLKKGKAPQPIRKRKTKRFK
jgi:hypothetical protein